MKRTMDVREKLVELLKQMGKREREEGGVTWYDVADHLIAHSVAVQGWISVKDRLPEKPMKCLVYTKWGEYGGYEITYYNEGFYLHYANITHWMPLPQPPKGE